MTSKLLVDLCWGLCYVTEVSNRHIEAVIKSGAIGYPLVLMICNSTRRVAMAALRLLGNVSTGTDSQTQVHRNW